MSFNIKTRALFDTTIIHLVDPETEMEMYEDDAQTKPLTIEVYGRSSSQYRKWLDGATRKADKERKANKGVDKLKTTDESIEDSADMLAAISINAANWDYAGEPVASKEAFRKVYADPSLMWIGEQVAKKLGDMSAFLPK